MGGEAAVESHSAQKQPKFNGFQEVMPTDDGRGRQFVSQLGALAERERPPTNSLSYISVLMHFFSNAAVRWRFLNSNKSGIYATIGRPYPTHLGRSATIGDILKPVVETIKLMTATGYKPPQRVS